ncbi:MAG TPA: 3-oxoacid CoA-transferase subunit B [Candidatus Dormibacteraeota bacterium]|nr:3-oxoacid CoA-transferase subunit B [Candidatus Dormibacteraeota bacterium]
MSAERGWTEPEIARRVLADLWEGAYVNLGIGMPLLLNELLTPEMGVILHSENGILGMGPAPPPDRRDDDIVDAGKAHVTLVPGASVFHSADSFAMLRGGHLDVAVLGAYQVSMHGDLANWKRPGQRIAGVGGAADISVGAKQVWVMMRHLTKDGAPRIVRECTFPLTARGVVKRIYTDMAVIDVTAEGLQLKELAPGYTAAEVVAATDAPLAVLEGVRD